MKKKSIIIGGVVILMAVFVGVALNNKPKEEDTIGGYKDGPRVEVEYVQKQDIDTKVTSSGKLEAVKTKTLYIDASNKVITLYKETGDRVKAGEVLITLDKEARLEAQNQIDSLEKQIQVAKQEIQDLRSGGTEGDILQAQSAISELQDQKRTAEKNISDSQANIDNYKRQITKAEEDLEMNKALLEQGALASKDVKDKEDEIKDLNDKIQQEQKNIKLSQDSFKTLELKIKNAQYNLSKVQNNVLDKETKTQILEKESAIKQLETQIFTQKNTLSKASTQVVAPIDGVITYQPEAEGMTLQAGEKILTIVDPDTLKVSCDISTYYAPDLKLGLDAVVKYAGSKTIEVPGKVSKISPVATTQKTTNGETIALPVEVKVEKPGDVLRPGFNVDVRITTDSRKGALVVPILAVEEDDDMSYVYVVGEDGTLEKREVTEGISNGLNIEVTGVKEGELIVSNIEDFVEDGKKVSYDKADLKDEADQSDKEDKENQAGKETGDNKEGKMDKETGDK